MTFYSPNFQQYSRNNLVAPVRCATIGDEGWSDNYQNRNSSVLAVVFPFDHHPTFDPAYSQGKKANKTLVSLDDQPFDLTQNIVSITTIQDKDNPLWSCEVRLSAMPKNNLQNNHPDKRNWLTNEAPFAIGDWLCIWLFDNQEDRDLVAGLSAGTFNAWRSGLKFMGRIQEISPQFGIENENGAPEVAFSIKASFDVWQSPVNLHPMMLTQMAAQAGQFAADILALAPLVKTDPKTGAIELPLPLTQDAQFWGARLLDFFAGEDASLVPPEKALNFLMDGLLCFGIYGESVAPLASLENIPAPAALSANAEFPPLTPYKPSVFPPSLSGLLSLPSVEMSIDTWAGNGSFTKAPWSIFPVSEPKTVGLFMAREIGIDGKLAGSTLLMQGNLNGDDLWASLSKFANEPINEMFFALKPQEILVPIDMFSSELDEILTNSTSSWRIMPTVVARQQPFNTQTLKTHLQLKRSTNASKFRIPEVTRLKDLRHWLVSPSHIHQVNISKSNQIVNMVQISGTDVRLATSNQDAYRAFKDLYNPPVIDPVSVQRYGLKTYMTDVSGIQTFLTKNQDIGDQLIDPSFFSRMMADIKMRHHRYYKGSITLTGVQEPLCVGDNLIISHGESDGTEPTQGAFSYINGMAAHITRVIHSAQIYPNGAVSFLTTVEVDWATTDIDDSYDDIIASVVTDVAEISVGGETKESQSSIFNLDATSDVPFFPSLPTK